MLAAIPLEKGTRTTHHRFRRDECARIRLKKSFLHLSLPPAKRNSGMNVCHYGCP